jgi:hypothetical protein
MRKWIWVTIFLLLAGIAMAYYKTAPVHSPTPSPHADVSEEEDEEGERKPTEQEVLYGETYVDSVILK